MFLLWTLSESTGSGREGPTNLLTKNTFGLSLYLRGRDLLLPTFEFHLHWPEVCLCRFLVQAWKSMKKWWSRTPPLGKWWSAGKPNFNKKSCRKKPRHHCEWAKDRRVLKCDGATRLGITPREATTADRHDDLVEPGRANAAFREAKKAPAPNDELKALDVGKCQHVAFSKVSEFGVSDWPWDLEALENAVFEHNVPLWDPGQRWNKSAGEFKVFSYTCTHRYIMSIP